MYMKRRQFIHTALAAIPAVAMPRFASAADATAPLPDVEALTSDRKEILLKGTDVKDFAARLRGELLMRDSAGYDTARFAIDQYNIEHLCPIVHLDFAVGDLAIKRRVGT